MEEDRRKLAAATIEAVRSRVAKERARATAKGLTAEALDAQHGTAEAHAKKVGASNRNSLFGQQKRLLCHTSRAILGFITLMPCAAHALLMEHRLS